MPRLHILRDTRGGALVEYAIVFPLMLSIFLGGFDLGIAGIMASRLSWVTSNAATQAGRRAACCTDELSTINWAVEQSGVAQTPAPIRPRDPPATWVVHWNAGCGIAFSVNTKYSFLFLPGPVPMNFVSCAPSCYQC